MASFGNNQFSRLGRYKLADNQKFIGGNFAPFIPAISGTGAGTTSVSPGNGYLYQTFTASGTLLVSQPVIADILIVGGGGAGGNTGGGGGAGGLIFVPNYNLSADTYTISVGAGAGAATSVTGNPSYILTGAGTTFLTARGGGCGENNPITSATNGGSGGGGVGLPAGTATQPTYTQGIPAPSYQQYGNNGGPGPRSGGGGGGAGSVGGAAYPGVYLASGGGGGTGRQYIDFSGPLIGVPALSAYSGYYSGGGGGTGYFNPAFGGGNGGPGGSGIGGAGASAGPSISQGTAGVTNTGSGGGGGATPAAAPATGKSGGSGIVVIRYQVSP